MTLVETEASKKEEDANESGTSSCLSSPSQQAQHQQEDEQEQVSLTATLTPSSSSESSNALTEQELDSLRLLLQSGKIHILKEEEVSLLKQLAHDKKVSSKALHSRPHAHVFLPEDSFSFFTFVPVLSYSFLYALLVFFIQITSLGLLMADAIDLDNQQNPLEIPPSVERPVRACQLLALLIAVMSQSDVVASVSLLHNGYSHKAFSEVVEGDANNNNNNNNDDEIQNRNDYDDESNNSNRQHEPTRPKWLTSIFSRLLVGILGLAVTFILVMKADTARDVLLNFTAIEFVSDIDNIVFLLARMGFLGQHVKNDAHSPLFDNEFDALHKKCSLSFLQKGERLLHTLLLVAVFLGVMSGWILIALQQNRGDFLSKSILVQFGDEFSPQLGTFSGLYHLETSQKDMLSTARAQYIEERSGQAKLGYCHSANGDGFWTLSTEEEDACTWRARSSDSNSFDILNVATLEWFVKDAVSNRVVPLQYLRMRAYDGYDQTTSQELCSGHGNFTGTTNKCTCDSGWFGLYCDFLHPCERMAVDIRRDGFLSTREWSTEFSVIRDDATGEIVTAYDRPVFANGHDERRREVILFTGRRWILFDLPKDAILMSLLKNFHAHFSTYEAAFISEPMDVGTPKDAMTPVGLNWFHAVPRESNIGRNGMPLKQQQQGMQAVDYTRRSEALLLCAVCNNTTNPCQNNGQCIHGNIPASSSCRCPVGSEGSLCESPPLGNGRCDVYFNTPAYGFDGGDCCESTCVSTETYLCGKDDSGYHDMGYSFCNQPEHQWKRNSAPITGSRALASSGSAVALSRNAATLVVGESGVDTVRLFFRDGSDWIQRESWVGPRGSEFGSTVVLSVGETRSVIHNPSAYAPVTVAIGGPSYNDDVGMVRVYECTILRCSQVGVDLEGDANLGPAEFGRAIALSADGMVLVVSTAPTSGVLEENQGVLVYERDDASWNLRQEVTPIVGSTTNSSTFGEVLSISGNGDLLVVGSGYEELDLFLVQSYQWDGATYQLLSSEITAAYHRRQSFALSEDSTVLAVGSKLESSSGVGMTVYEWNEQDKAWKQRGSSIEGSCCSADLSRDGSILAVAGLKIGGGTVKAFQWNKIEYEPLWNNIPGKSAGAISISGDGSTIAAGRPTYKFYRGQTTVYQFLSNNCGNSSLLTFHLSLTFDEHPEETRWELKRNSTSEVVLEGRDYSEAHAFTTIVEDVCIDPTECYDFTIYDKEGKSPAIHSPGGYSIFVNGQQRGKGGSFQYMDRIQVGNCRACRRGRSRLLLLIVTGGEDFPSGEHTSWSVRWQGPEKEILLQGGNYSGYNQMYTEEMCVPSQDCAVSFTMFQSNVDVTTQRIGMSKFRLFLDGNLILEGGGDWDGPVDPARTASLTLQKRFKFPNC